MRIIENKTGVVKIHHTPNTKYDFIDRAAAGDVEAAALLAEGYLKGIYECEKNPKKALKWGKYAAGKGSGLGKEVVRALTEA